MTVFGLALIEKFGRKHADARRPLGRFVAIAGAAEWKHFPDLKNLFPAADYTPDSGTVIFDIGGNKYRLTARVDFKAQVLVIENILTHEKYTRKEL